MSIDPTPAALNVLLTGFEPFEQDPLNPSWEVARALDGWQHAGATVRAVQLPCVFGDAITRLDQALQQFQPTLVLCLGLAGGRAALTPERVAINVDDARIPDHAGRQPVDIPVVAGGPAAYFSTLPIKAMVRDMLAQGVPAAVSNTAGTFVCNHIFYALMHRLAQAGGTVRGGFMHVPTLPALAALHPGMPSMALETQVRGVQQAIQTAMEVREDVRETGGQLH
jgi:pyroglutamyl-peptidase